MDIFSSKYGRHLWSWNSEQFTWKKTKFTRNCFQSNLKCILGLTTKSISSKNNFICSKTRQTTKFTRNCFGSKLKWIWCNLENQFPVNTIVFSQTRLNIKFVWLTTKSVKMLPLLNAAFQFKFDYLAQNTQLGCRSPFQQCPCECILFIVRIAFSRK